MHSILLPSFQQLFEITTSHCSLLLAFNSIGISLADQTDLLMKRSRISFPSLSTDYMYVSITKVTKTFWTLDLNDLI